MANILVAIPELSYTGALFSAKRICRVLLENGCEVAVWSHKEGAFEKEFVKLDIKPRIISSNYIYYNENVEDELKEYDLLIANTINTYALADKAKNIIPTIWYIHEAQNLPEMFFLKDVRKYFAFMRAEKIYVVSEYAAEFIKKNYHLEVCVVWNCVEDEAAKYRRTNTEGNPKIKFLALGTIEPRKAFEIFLKAYIGLTAEEKAQCEVHFAGGLLENFKDYYIPLLDLADREEGIFYHGEIQERNRLLQLMADSDVIVVPSKDESCSLVALEAAMMSKPLIISENIGARYVVTAKNGWIFETGNTERLREIYREVLMKRNCLRDMGTCSRGMYLKTSTYEIYKKSIWKMVSEHLTQDKRQYRLEHEDRIEQETRQRIREMFEEDIRFPGKRIAIYAAGEVGRNFFKWCGFRQYKVIAWVDKSWEKCRSREYGLPLTVETPEKLQETKFDLICIAVKKQELAEEIKRELVGAGIAQSKILWTHYRRFDGKHYETEIRSVDTKDNKTIRSRLEEYEKSN